jgi:hypothetical protein
MGHMLSWQWAGLVSDPCVDDNAEHQDDKKHDRPDDKNADGAGNSAEDTNGIHATVDSGGWAAKRQLGSGHRPSPPSSDQFHLGHRDRCRQY